MDYRKRKTIVSCYLAWFSFWVSRLYFLVFPWTISYMCLKRFSLINLPSCSQSLFGDISVVTWVAELAGPNHSHSHTKRRRKVHSKNFSRKRHKSPLLSSKLHVYSLFLDLVILFNFQRRPQFNVFCCQMFYILAFVWLMNCWFFTFILQLKLFFTEVTFAKPKSSRNSSIGECILFSTLFMWQIFLWMQPIHLTALENVINVVNCHISSKLNVVNCDISSKVDFVIFQGFQSLLYVLAILKKGSPVVCTEKL